MDWGSLGRAESVWFFIGLFCVITEFFLPGVIIVFFGAGAWAVALLVHFVRIPVTLQVLIFISVSAIALVTLRRRFNPISADDLSDAESEFIGKTAQVTQTVSREAPGQVRFKGALWAAQTRSDHILAEGTRVRIVGHDSIVLLVDAMDPLRREE